MIEFLKANWWKFPFIPFRIVLFGLTFGLLKPLAVFCELLFDLCPGLTDTRPRKKR